MRPVAALDAEDRSVRAMSRIAGEAEIADAASRIDLADNPAANEFGGVRRGFDHADKLVAESALKTGVSASDLEVGVADAGTQYPDTRFAFATGTGDVVERKTAICNAKSFHSEANDNGAQS